MDGTWVILITVWAVVEFIQFLRKRPFPQRMKTGAYWGVAFAALSALGSASKDASTFGVLAVSLLIFGVIAALICTARILISNKWRRSTQK